MTPWMQMHNGTVMDLCNPDYKDMTIEAVAHSLSNIVRFLGHTDIRLSIAEHSVNVARVLPNHLKMQGLLHDGHECTFGDMPTPWKMVFGPMAREMERKHRTAFCERFRTPIDLGPEVKEADLRMLFTEREQVMKNPPKSWGLDAEPYDHIKIIGYSPEIAKARFLAMYEKLRNQNK